MLKDALIILKKELGNVFSDRRAIFANFVLPLILMIAIFSVIGVAQKSQENQNKAKVFHVAVADAPNAAFEMGFLDDLRRTGLLFDLTGEPERPDAVTIRFSPGWDGHSSGSETILAFDTTRQDMQFAAGKVREAVAAVNDRLAAQKLASVGLESKDLKPIVIGEKSLAVVNSAAAPLAATILPYLLIIMVFSGSLGLGMASTAGEKENGSLASLLVNQVSRSSIALGKVFAIMLMGLVNAVMNVIGVVLGVLFVAQGDAGAASAASGDTGLLGVIANPGTIVLLLISLLMASAIASSVVVYLGTLAKNMKEASGYIMPVFIVVIGGALFTMTMDVSKDPALFAIPLINVVFLLKAAILSSVGALQLVIAVAVNLALAGGLVVLIAREFNSERVLYSA